MKEKKENRIGFTLPSGITFWFANNGDGLQEMVTLLERYEKMQVATIEKIQAF